MVMHPLYPPILANNNDMVMRNYEFLAGATQLQHFDARRLSDSYHKLSQFSAFSESRMQEVNLPSHHEGLQWNGTDARYPQNVIDLFRDYTAPENRFTGISAPERLGGSDMLNSLQPVLAIMGFKNNPQFYLKEMVTTSVINAVRQAIDKERDPDKIAMLENVITQIIDGDFTGAMVLTEPQGGSNLGSEMEVAAKIPQGSDKAEVNGIKNLITGASTGGTKAHNVIHLVVSVLHNDKGEIEYITDPETGKRTIGTTVTLVPKYKLDEKGNTLQPPQENGITISKPYNKPGIEPQILTAVEYKDSQGIMLGERGKGWDVMFGVMNPARLKVAAQGVATSQEAYELCADFASQRGLAAGSKAIMEHPQMAERLHRMRAYALLGTSALMEVGRNIDLAKGAAPEVPEIERQKIGRLIELQTPMLKAYCTERGKESAKLAVDITAGFGYTNERIPKLAADIMPATFYEGTNQMMARNVATRSAFAKMPEQGTDPKNWEQATMDYFIEQTKLTIKQHQQTPGMEQVINPLKLALRDLESASRILEAKYQQYKEKGPNATKAMYDLLAASEEYTMLFGDITMAAQAVKVYAQAHEKLQQTGLDEGQKAYYETNKQTAAYFSNMVLEPNRHKYMASIKAVSQHLQPAAEWETMMETRKQQLAEAGGLTLNEVRAVSCDYRPQRNYMRA